MASALRRWAIVNNQRRKSSSSPANRPIDAATSIHTCDATS
jgi:hypothetical protein